MPRRPCLVCGALSSGSYCETHKKREGGTGQRGSTWAWRKQRRRILERDGHQCTFIQANGERCPATTRLEVDHIEPVAFGGSDDDHNLRTRCFDHNPRGRRHSA